MTERSESVRATDRPAIEVRGLTKRFGTVVALAGLDLDVPQGSVFGLLGPNGAGKTTALRLLTGLGRPSGGTASVDGVPVVAGGPALARRIGYLDQDPRFYAWMTGRELLELAGRAYGLEGQDLRERVDDILETVGLTDAGHRRIGGYSGGMRQRLGVGQAILPRPRVVFLDEPVSALDPAGRRDVLGLIGGLRGSITVVMSTHILNDVERVCDRVAILDHGRLVTEAPIDELLARHARPIIEIDPEPGQADAVASLVEQLQAAGWTSDVRLEHGLVRATVTDARGGRYGRAPGRGHERSPSEPGIRACPSAAWRMSSCSSWARTAERCRVSVSCCARSCASWSAPCACRWCSSSSPSWASSRPCLARYIREILQAVGGAQFQGVIPDPVARDAVAQLTKNVGQFGVLIAILISMGTVATEKDRGTAAFLLTKPLGRGAFLGAKAAAIGSLLAIATLLAGVLCWTYTTDPVRATAGRWLPRGARARVALPGRVRGGHVPGLGRRTIGAGGRWHRPGHAHARRFPVGHPRSRSLPADRLVGHGRRTRGR